MRKRRCLFGFILLLVMLLAPNSAVAFPSAFESSGSQLATALGQYLELVTNFLAGNLSSGIDPDGRAVLPAAATDDGDLGPGWDPWGSALTPSDTTNEGDLGHGIDPDG